MHRPRAAVQAVQAGFGFAAGSEGRKHAILYEVGPATITKVKNRFRRSNVESC